VGKFRSGALAKLVHTRSVLEIGLKRRIFPTVIGFLGRFIDMVSLQNNLALGVEMLEGFLRLFSYHVIKKLSDYTVQQPSFYAKHEYYESRTMM
jgi:hypothetical protein